MNGEEGATPGNPVVELAHELSSLRERHQVPLRELARRAQSNRQTMYECTDGKRLPDKKTVLSFVQGCTRDCGPRYRNAQERRFSELWERAEKWRREHE